jgi:pimeloyl-ACP methyl ester carboxylesterase
LVVAIFRKHAVNYYYLIPIVLFVTLLFSAHLVSVHCKRRDIAVRGKPQSVLAQNIRTKLKETYGAYETHFQSGNLTLAGIAIKRENPSYLFVLCHGYHFNKEFMHPFAALFENDNIFMFDFRTHGESQGDFISFGCAESHDVIAAVKHAQSLNLDKRNGTTLPIVVLGISMGGAAAIKAAREEPTLADALIVDSTFSTYSSMQKAAFNNDLWFLPQFPLGFFMKKIVEFTTGCSMGSISTVENIKHVTIPTLLVHSENDTLISHTNSQDIQACATSYCDLWVAPPSKHGFLYREQPQAYQAQVYTFLKKVL